MYDAVVNSPNGAFVCAMQHQNPLSPVIAAAPLAASPPESTVAESAAALVEPLAVRLALTIVRQGDSGDLLGRIAGLADASEFPTRIPSPWFPRSGEHQLTRVCHRPMHSSPAP